MDRKEDGPAHTLADELDETRRLMMHWWNLSAELLVMLNETTDELDGIMDVRGHLATTRDVRDRAYALIDKARASLPLPKERPSCEGCPD